MAFAYVVLLMRSDREKVVTKKDTKPKQTTERKNLGALFLLFFCLSPPLSSSGAHRFHHSIERILKNRSIMCDTIRHDYQARRKENTLLYVQRLTTYLTTSKSRKKRGGGLRNGKVVDVVAAEYRADKLFVTTPKCNYRRDHSTLHTPFPPPVQSLIPIYKYRTKLVPIYCTLGKYLIPLLLLSCPQNSCKLIKSYCTATCLVQSLLRGLQSLVALLVRTTIPRTTSPRT